MDDEEFTVATVTIIKTLTEGDVLIAVDAVSPEGEDVPLIDALGMIEMAKSILLEQAGRE